MRAWPLLRQLGSGDLRGLGRRSRPLTVAGPGLVLAGAAATRYAVRLAGRESAART